MQSYFLYPLGDELILSPDEEERRKNAVTRSAYFRRLDDRLPAELVQSFGPTDIAVPFSLHLSMVIEEKRVTRVDAEIGWMHQGIEKAFELVPWRTGPSFATRINPRIPAPLGLGFALAVEELLHIEDQVPIAAQTWRIMMLECARIFHHLRVIYKTINLSAPFALKQFAAQVLEKAQTLHQQICYDDYHVLQVCLGGIVSSLNKEQLLKIKAEINSTSKLAHYLTKDIFAEKQIQQRLSYVGSITKDTALSFGLTGPTLRGCGAADDLRRSHPYFGYANFPPSVCLQEIGDVWSRFKVRLEEIAASFDILDKAINAVLLQIDSTNSLPIKLSLDHLDWEHFPLGTQVSYLEAPEGELAITLVSDGKERPYRVRFRTPSFAQTAALPAFLQNADIDDVILIILSLGIVDLEVDR